MTIPQDTVSVIVPAFNAERHIGEALDSVMAQSTSCHEVIVVDDGSSDKTAAIARSYHPNVRLVQTANHGPGAARNRGIERATGELLAFLDADDRWTSKKLQGQLAVMSANPRLDGVFGRVRHFISPEVNDDVRSTLVCPPGAQPGICLGTLLIRRSAFDRVGPLKEGLRVGEFIDWYARAKDQLLQWEMIEEVVLERRLHETNHGRTGGSDRVEFASVIRGILARRRS